MNAELIKALRICGHASGCPEFCPRYRTYDDGLTCAQHVIFDAADALEAAEKRIAELSLDNKMLKNTIDADKGVMLDRIRFLEKQKEGEWIGIEYDGYADGYTVYDVWECSERGEEHNGEEHTLPNYCPNCGAKMKGEHDEQID